MRRKFKITDQKRTSITQWCHDTLEHYLPRQGNYIDATMGNGHDTLFLCGLAEDRGHVYAFDIQQKALVNTRKRLEEHGVKERLFSLILDTHIHMGRYLEPETIDGIMFNCGYLPGQDHRLATRPETTVEAVQGGLKLLRPGGIMNLCLYSGGDTGPEEKEAVLSYLRHLDSKAYTVIVQEYYNRGNCPPAPVFIFRR